MILHSERNSQIRRTRAIVLPFFVLLTLQSSLTFLYKVNHTFGDYLRRILISVLKLICLKVHILSITLGVNDPQIYARINYSHFLKYPDSVYKFFLETFPSTPSKNCTSFPQDQQCLTPFPALAYSKKGNPITKGGLLDSSMIWSMSTVHSHKLHGRNCED